MWNSFFLLETVLIAAVLDSGVDLNTEEERRLLDRAFFVVSSFAKTFHNFRCFLTSTTHSFQRRPFRFAGCWCSHLLMPDWRWRSDGRRRFEGCCRRRLKTSLDRDKRRPTGNSNKVDSKHWLPETRELSFDPCWWWTISEKANFLNLGSITLILVRQFSFRQFKIKFSHNLLRFNWKFNNEGFEYAENIVLWFMFYVFYYCFYVC